MQVVLSGVLLNSCCPFFKTEGRGSSMAAQSGHGEGVWDGVD